MSIVVTDPALVKQLAEADAVVEMRDADGNYLGTFAPHVGKLPTGFRSPYTDEQIEQLRQQPDGRPLADILRDLEQRR